MTAALAATNVVLDDITNFGEAVYDYYMDRGISRDRMHVRNRGASYPPCDKEDPEEGCRRGRRVESLPMDCRRFQDLVRSPSYGN